MSRLNAPQKAPTVQLKDVHGTPITLSENRFTLLSFYRDPACPFCNFHLYLMTNKYQELQSLGLDFVAVFPADPENVKKIILSRQRPFPVAVDTTNTAINSYGVAASPTAQATQASQSAYNLYGIERSFWRKMLAVLRRPLMWLQGMTKVGFPETAKALGGINTANNLPADFLISGDGIIKEAYYGKDAGDHVSLEHLRTLVSRGYF